jgi:hypothetical protein
MPVKIDFQPAIGRGRKKSADNGDPPKRSEQFSVGKFRQMHFRVAAARSVRAPGAKVEPA